VAGQLEPRSETPSDSQQIPIGPASQPVATKTNPARGRQHQRAQQDQIRPRLRRQTAPALHPAGRQAPRAGAGPSRTRAWRAAAESQRGVRSAGRTKQHSGSGPRQRDQGLALERRGCSSLTERRQVGTGSLRVAAGGDDRSGINGSPWLGLRSRIHHPQAGTKTRLTGIKADPARRCSGPQQTATARNSPQRDQNFGSSLAASPKKARGLAGVVAGGHGWASAQWQIERIAGTAQILKRKALSGCRSGTTSTRRFASATRVGCP